MNTDNLTREQAIELCGLPAVEAVEAESCDYTSRLLPEPYESDGFAEWSASIECEAGTLAVYYLTTPEDEKILTDTGDGSNVDWLQRIDHYSLM